MTSRSKVLVVEDNPTEQKLLSMLIKRFNFEPLVVSNGADALAILESDHHDIQLILMDWQMDDMDGLECTRHIRAAQKISNRSIPIVGVTARVMLGDRQKCMQAGMDDYLSKPFTLHQFETMLNQWSTRNTAMTG